MTTIGGILLGASSLVLVSAADAESIASRAREMAEGRVYRLRRRNQLELAYHASGQIPRALAARKSTGATTQP